MISVITTDGQKLFDTFVRELKKQNRAICILAARPYTFARDILRQKKIDPTQHLFIDTIGTQNADENVIFVKQTDITNLSLTIQQAAQALPNPTIIFDSFTSFGIQLPQNVFARFTQFTISQLRKTNIDCKIIIEKNSPYKEITGLLLRTADKVEER